MTRIILDSTTIQKLRSVDDAIDVCDEHGRTVGLFVPAGDDSEDHLAWPLSDEQIEARRQETDLLTTAEVLARLQEP